MISVIIPTRNRADLLETALDSLTRQVLPSKVFEVLVISNNSTDNTKEVVKKYFNLLRNLRYLPNLDPSLHSGRHLGMLEAQGDILVFADDDIEALPTWLSTIQDVFDTSNVVMVGGNNLPLFIEPPPQWLKYLWEQSSIYGGRALPTLSILELPGNTRQMDPYLVWGCNFSIRKDVLIEIGGFHPDGMPPELIRFRGDGETHVSHYIKESGMKCQFHPGASVFHKVTPERMSFAYFRQRGYNQGVSDSYTELRNQNLPMPSSRKITLRSFTRSILYKINLMRIRDPEIKQALQAQRAGHNEGYVYHQRMYREDPEVRDWVHRENYF